MTSRIAALWHRYWFAYRVPAETLGLVRIALGTALLALHFTNFITLLGVDLSGARFHYLEPIWYFDLVGIEAVVPILSLAVFGLLLASTVAIILGYRTRTAIAVAILCIFYLKGVRDSAAGDVHHRYLMWVHALVFLMASRAGEVLSLDRRRLEREGRVRSFEAWEISWPLRAMQTYVVIFYCGSALAKLRVAGGAWFLDGTAAQKTLLEKSARWSFETLPLGSELANFPTLAWALVVFTIVVELGFPLVLLMRTVPRILFLAGMSVFHIANGVLLGVNFYITPFLFVVFFDVSKLRGVWTRAWWRRRAWNRPAPQAGGT
ncbi:MAG: HTTM domain-containing protein [Longimicrobiales bacterium]|nr:HTTM domain-containing protein [Longimicrobiales bacterium]